MYADSFSALGKDRKTVSRHFVSLTKDEAIEALRQYAKTQGSDLPQGDENIWVDSNTENGWALSFEVDVAVANVSE